ncbi:ComEC/Rec2 family competence protein [Cyclobacterium jeungdonense]|uniref:ComEC/Rec2 family competence protein n=1 Tax=Cyclobacterium jeungdonense TaxID=708087 RepID=A0ABT8CBN8_9BACT|nr:ComEC/Rec2 family competence protein [Cyclobacterium jeungdonense]MDN3689175.1 ComEC/Rec2 family competence protein [Cyclobacterium jeungdonense]
MKFNEFPFVRYTIFFVFGVLVYPYSNQMLPGRLLIALIVFLVLYTGLVLSYTPKARKSLYFLVPAIAYSNLVLMGMFVASIRDVYHDPDHLVHFSGISEYLAEVKDLDQPKPKSIANLVEVYAVRTQSGWQKANGKVQIYHRSASQLMPGSLLLIDGTPEKIPSSKNPEAFDYASFMSQKRIYYSDFIGSDFKLLHVGELPPWHAGIVSLRQFLEGKVLRFVEDDASAQIAKALLLGQKKDLDEDIGEAYATAGAMHILAVSGLHVGIIYGFFFLFFKPQKAKKFKRVLFLSLVVLLIWLYAAITGFSPSVLRAAAMFTFISVAQMKSRNPSIFNPLALSAMVLLVYDPFLVYAVGFQLSYTALLGILLFQPLIASLWSPDSRYLRYLWDISSVGLAAQLATFPLAIHYFHVFPTYFFLSNLLAIPGAFIIMSLGLTFLLLSYWSVPASFLGSLVNESIRLLNEGIFSFQKLPFAKLEFLYFRLPEMILIWSLLFCTYQLLIQRKKQQVLWVISVLVLLGFYRIFETWEKARQHYLLVYEVDQGLAIDYVCGEQVFEAMVEVEPDDFRYQILPHRIKQTGTNVGKLLVRDEDEFIHLELPGGKVLKLEKQTFRPKPDDAFKMHFWSAGKWREYQPSAFANSLPEAALKITFNNQLTFL